MLSIKFKTHTHIFIHRSIIPRSRTECWICHVLGRKFRDNLPILLISIYVTMTNFLNWSSHWWYTTCIWRGHFNV